MTKIRQKVLKKGKSGICNSGENVIYALYIDIPPPLTPSHPPSPLPPPPPPPPLSPPPPPLLTNDAET